MEKQNYFFIGGQTCLRFGDKKIAYRPIYHKRFIAYGVYYLYYIFYGNMLMIRLREILQQIMEARQKNMVGTLAANMGLERKDGYGNYGLRGSPVITQRSINGQLKPVTPHRIGQKNPMKGLPLPPIRKKFPQ